MSRNVARDREKDEELDKLGWAVVHVWEHEDPVIAADAIEQLWRSQTTARNAPGRDATPERVTCEILVDVHEIREDPGCP